MKILITASLILTLLLTVRTGFSQSTTGGSSPIGTENWFPNRGNVGIGTRTPSESLEVIGNLRVSGTTYTKDFETIGLKATTLSVLQDATIGRNLMVNGNIGIGVANPTERMEINGNLKVSNSIFGDQVKVNQFDATNGNVSNTLQIGQKFIVDGLTGLGVSAPVERLEVAGNMKATEALISDRINTGEGVFTRMYRLPKICSSMAIPDWAYLRLLKSWKWQGM